MGNTGSRRRRPFPRVAALRGGAHPQPEASDRLLPQIATVAKTVPHAADRQAAAPLMTDRQPPAPAACLAVYMTTRRRAP
jgi:hypothetical protein